VFNKYWVGLYAFFSLGFYQWRNERGSQTENTQKKFIRCNQFVTQCEYFRPVSAVEKLKYLFLATMDWALSNKFATFNYSQVGTELPTQDFLTYLNAGSM
jgi:hypothetical protein